MPPPAPLGKWGDETRDDDYRRAVSEWMSGGMQQTTRGREWAAYIFRPLIRAPGKSVHTSEDLADLSSQFSSLCSAQGGTSAETVASFYGELLRELRGADGFSVCLIDDKPFFAVSAHNLGAAFRIRHFDEAAFQASRSAHAEAERRRRAEEHEREQAEQEREQAKRDLERRARVLRLNLKTGDVVNVVVKRELVDTGTGRRVNMGSITAEAFVIEVNLPLVRVQVNSPAQEFWVRVEDIYPVGG